MLAPLELIVGILLHVVCHYTPGRWTNRTWKWMLWKMMFLFQGAHILRFQPFIFQGCKTCNFLRRKFPMSEISHVGLPMCLVPLPNTFSLGFFSVWQTGANPEPTKDTHKSLVVIEESASCLVLWLFSPKKFEVMKWWNSKKPHGFWSSLPFRGFKALSPLFESAFSSVSPQGAEEIERIAWAGFQASQFLDAWFFTSYGGCFLKWWVS